MSIDSAGQISYSFPNIPKTHLRYVVKDKVQVQVVDSDNGEVIREIPRKLSSNIYESLYA
jgi:uncharacterized FlaG/YvyC family protein